MEALYYLHAADSVTCVLCPHNCRIKNGKKGICRVRRNEEGQLVSDNYGRVSSIHSDPIEKKPLYHFFPGRSILSVGSFGCNLQCKFCQNWEISQARTNEYINLRAINPTKVASLADEESGNIGVAYTYNEPLVWIEYMLDIAGQVRNKHLKNVMVTNGFINPEPLNDLIEVMDAFSVDLKAFSEQFYRELTSSSLQPVLEALKMIKASGRHLEITNLVIPGRNDDPEDFTRMIDWIASELGDDTVLHISRYYPMFKLDDPPTPENTLLAFYKVARTKLQHVYLGNLRTTEGRHTFCPGCNTLVINRNGYLTDVCGLDHEGRCLNCRSAVINKEKLHLA